MRHHEPPVCDWNPDLPCPRCGLPIGFKAWDEQTAEACFFCATGEVRVAPDEGGKPGRGPDWIEEIANLGAG
jgi:hypothetical protein